MRHSTLLALLFLPVSGGARQALGASAHRLAGLFLSGLTRWAARRR